MKTVKFGAKRFVSGFCCVSLSAFFMLSPLSMRAETAIWTGAQDAFWTNVNNWVQADGVTPVTAVPGVLENGTEDVDPYAAVYDTALFNRSSSHTTIDLSGLYSVRNITVSGAATPVYTFGVSSEQTLRFVSEAQCNSYNNGSVFLIEASVVNMPIIAATLSARGSGTLNEGFHITNKSSEPMEIGDIGRFTNAAELGVYPENIENPDGSLPSWATAKAIGGVFVQLDGTGPFTLAGSFVAGVAGRYRSFLFKSTGGYTVAEGHDIDSVYMLNVVAKTSLSIPAGSRFAFSTGGDFTVSAGGGFITQGDGLFELQGRADGNHPTVLYMYQPSPWTSASRLSVTNLSGAPPESTELVYGGVGAAGAHGTINFTGENLFSGVYSFLGVGFAGPRYTAAALGADGEPGPMGRTSLIRLFNEGTFVYTGPGETSSRTFEIAEGHANYGGNTMVLEQAGTGTWTVESRIRQACADATLVLRNGTASPAVFARKLGGETYNGSTAVLALRKEGVGEWRLSAENVYTGPTTIKDGTLTLAPGGTLGATSGLVFEGGAFEVTGTAGMPRTVTLPAVSVMTAKFATLYVTGNAVVSVSSIGHVSGRLNICTAGEGAVVKLPVSLAGTSPHWIRFNGASVEIAADGTVSAGDEPVTAEIPAKGGEITDDAAASVGITSPGTEGPITLAATSVTVSNLIQQSTTEATVDLGGGTLTARSLLVDRGERAPMTVGTSAENGSVKALDGTLLLENRATNGSLLTVSVPLALSAGSDRLVKRGAGRVRLTEPLGFTGELDIEKGELAVSNITTIAPTLVGAGVFVKEGSRDFRFSNVKYTDFTGEIRCSGGTNALPANANMENTRYFFRFTEGTSIAPVADSGFYDSQNMRVHVSGDGADGEGVMCLNIAGNARVFPFLTLDGDTSFNALHRSCWLQFGGSMYNSRAGVIDMGGHKFVKRDGAGTFRFSDGGKIVNPGEIIVDHFTGTEGNSTIELYDDFSLGGPGAPALTLGSNTLLRSINADAQTRKLRINGSNVQLQITPGAYAGPGDVWGGLEFASSEDSLAVNCTAVGDWRVDFTGPITGSGTLTLGGSSPVAAGTVNFLAAGNDFNGKIVVNPDTRLSIVRPFAADASPSVSVAGSVVLGTVDWTPAQIEKFMDNADLSGNGNVVLDGSSGTLADLSSFTLPLTMTIGSVSGIARVSLKDASLMSWSVVNGDRSHYLKENGHADYYAKAIVVGDRGSGILEIGEGTAITNRLIVGGNSGSPRGAVYQKGGRFCSFGSPEDAVSASGLALGDTSKAYGYYELTGGVLEFTGGQSFCANGASAVLYVDGGDIVTTRRPANCNPVPNWRPSLNLAYSGHAVVEIRSGHMNLSDCNVLTCRTGTSAPSLVLTVSGEDARFTAATMFCCGYASSSCSIVNIADGGTFTSPYISRNNTSPASRTYVNFDGGTFVTTTAANYWVFGANDVATMVSKVTVFGGGATLETPTATYSPKIWEVSGPTGKGVSAVDTGTVGDLTLVGSPRVVIEGDGWGASAYADFDSASGRVTGIRVTSPGCDYTEASAKVLYGDTVLAENLAVTLEDNVGGSFTKSGPGTLQLMATNTWHGATVVKEGTLAAKTDGSIPQGRPLVLDGGTIDLGGFDFTFAGITGSGGTVGGGTANIAGDWVLDGETLVSDAAARRCTTVSGNVVVDSDVCISVENPELLDESKSYRILCVTNGSLTGGEDVTTDLPAPWCVVRGASGFRLSCPRCLQIIVR